MVNAPLSLWPLGFPQPWRCILPDGVGEQVLRREQANLTSACEVVPNPADDASVQPDRRYAHELLTLTRRLARSFSALHDAL